MKRIISLIALCLSLSISVAQATTISHGQWTVTLDDTSHLLTVKHGQRALLNDAFAEARLGEAVLQSSQCAEVSINAVGVDDCFGQGQAHTISYLMSSGARLVQTFAFYDHLPYIVVSLGVTAPSGQARSNYLAPLKSATRSAFMPQDNKNRVLFVPFDNDGFIRYASNYLRGNATNSYNATAIYNSVTREGLVAGAVDHYYWKNAIHVKGSDYYNLDEFTLISGYTDSRSHDVAETDGSTMPHGAVVADTVCSSRFVMGFYDDWRQGMESFGEACTLVAPRRQWDGGAPYGWSSWGVQQTSISYQGVIDCADFIRDNLVPHGFHDRQGRVVMSLDAWWNDNLSTSQITQFVSYCTQNNMIPGLYYGPFCRFGDLQSIVPGTNNRYRFRDLALKVKGEYKMVDGAYCLDPTHPGTKMFMLSETNKFKQWGIEYLKCDFQSNGAIEADSWYADTCYTGLQAYNIGMQYLLRRLGDDIYVDLSIAPAFPYQYAHGRRISCDAWGTIGSTQYVMNCAIYGWWLNQLYVANDPDHMVMCMRQYGDGVQSEGANRARITSGAVVGAFLTGDNFSPNITLWRDNDHSKGSIANYWETSQQRALQLLTNKDINEIPRTCRTFRPVYGNAQSGNTQAENLMTYENDRYVYLAVLNYQLLLPQQADMPFEHLGIDPDNVGAIKELWTQTDITPSATGLRYNVPGQDARIYRIEKKTQTDGIISHPIGEASPSGGGWWRPSAGGDLQSPPVYDLLGRRVESSNLKKGIYIYKGRVISDK